MSARSTSFPYLGQFVVSGIGPAIPEKVVMDVPSRTVAFWRDHIESSGTIHAGKEHVVVIALNLRFRVMGWHLVAMGSPSGAWFRLAEVFRPLIVAGAFQFVLVHNHPSGDPTPSLADRQLTRQVIETGQTMNLACVDHVVIGDEDYFSFAEHGLMDVPPLSDAAANPPAASVPVNLMDTILAEVRALSSERVEPVKDASAPLTAAELFERWAVPGGTPQKRLYNLRARCRSWGLKPLKGTQGMEALFLRGDVHAAEDYARARGLGKLARRRHA